jgi:hypothetical protein
MEKALEGNLIIEPQEKIIWTGQKEVIEVKRKDIMKGSREGSGEWIAGTLNIHREGIKGNITMKGEGLHIKKDHQGSAQVQEEILNQKGKLLLIQGIEDVKNRIEIIVPTAEVRFLQIQITAFCAGGAEPKRREGPLHLMSQGDRIPKSRHADIRKEHILRSNLVGMRKGHILWNGNVDIRKEHILQNGNLGIEKHLVKVLNAILLKDGNDKSSREWGGKNRHFRQRDEPGINLKQKLENPKRKGLETSSYVKIVEIRVYSSLQMDWDVAQGVDTGFDSAQDQLP